MILRFATTKRRRHPGNHSNYQTTAITHAYWRIGKARGSLCMKMGSVESLPVHSRPILGKTHPLTT